MNKQAFLKELEQLTAALTEQERARLLEYYGEMIDDRMEEGLDEAEAVAALGDAADIARQFAPEARQSTPQAANEAITALRRLRIRVANADVRVVREPLENGAAAQLRFSDPSRFEWHADGDALEVSELEEAGRSKRGFGFRELWRLLGSDGQRLTVALSDGLPGDLDHSSAGGNLTLEGVAIGGAARLHSASGDFELKQAVCAGALEIVTQSGDLQLDGVSARSLSVQATSGDINAASLSVEGAARTQTASGDVELRAVKCGALSIICASGDVEIDRGAAGSVTVRTASGDVRMDELEADPRLSVQTASGDVELTRCIARETRLNTASGDVELRLEQLPCGYDIAANTRSGDISLPRDNVPAGDARPEIAVSTVSGDIDISILGE